MELISDFYIFHKSNATYYDESKVNLLMFGFIAEKFERSKNLYVPFALKQMCKAYVIGKGGKRYCCICKSQCKFSRSSQIGINAQQIGINDNFSTIAIFDGEGDDCSIN